jgi:hypothetical protein
MGRCVSGAAQERSLGITRWMRTDPPFPLSVPARRLLTALLLAAAVCVPAAAQTTMHEVEPEAPATLLPLKLGDAGVDISIAGSWSALFSFGMGMLVAPGVPVRALDSLPGITPGIAFSQVPDLSLSLTLLERWFIEISVLGGFSDNSLLMGYRGDGEEPVRHVLLGTRDITAAPTPFLETPAQEEGSLGISALVVSGIGMNEALLRWDATGEQRRLYLGPNELLEERIGLDSWLRGRVLVLPDAGVENLVVLLEDPNGTLVADPAPTGDGRTYRQAGFNDVIVDAAAGRVTLRSEWKGRVLVWYRKGAAFIGDATLGMNALAGQDGSGRRDLGQLDVQFRWNMPANYLNEDLDDRKVTVPGIGDCLLLWEPGDQSPFQAANTYAFSIAAPSETSRVTAFLEKKAAGALVPANILFQIDATARQVSLLVKGTDFRDDFYNWYPFWTAPPDAPINLLYGPERNALSGLLDLELVVQALQPVDGYVLGSDVVPGSVRVTVNSLEERRFTFDKSTGRLTFQVEIAPTDRIEVHWRTADVGSAGGDVLLTWRDDIQLAENLGFWAAAGLRWNVGTGLTAGEPYARSGAVVAAAGIEGSVGALDWSINAAGSFANPDTTGVVRLHGMEGHSLVVDLSEELAWPSSPPLGSTQANRGKLLYRDYRSYDAFGGAELHAIDWTGATTVPYDNGGRTGPYSVLGSFSSESSGRSLVFEYELPADGDWVGAQVPVAAGSLPDLSTAKSITMRLRGVVLTGDVEVRLEVGAIGEDLDGDGMLDAEPSATATGFSFNDSAHGSVVLKVGAGPRLEGNGVKDSEDRDGSSTLTPEDSTRVVQRSTGSIVDTDWHTFTWDDLTDGDRAKLQQARSIRIVIVATAGGSVGATGRIRVDRVSVAGSGYWAEAASGAVTVLELPETLSNNDPGTGNRLGDVEPDAMKLFHPSGETQEVLEMSWTAGTSGFELTGYTTKLTGGITYDTASVLIRGVGNARNSGVSIDFALLDSAGLGIRWTLDPMELPDEGWHELAASRGGLITLDGAPLTGTSTFDTEHGELSLLKVAVSGLSGATIGALVLDEVHLRDPHTAWGAALRAEASWSKPGILWQAGSVPLIANVSIDQKLSLVTAGFSSLYGTPSAAGDITSRTEIGADILYARLRADIVLSGIGGEFVGSGGHRLTIPAAPSVVTFSDTFSLTGSNEFSREDTLRVQPFDALTVSLDAKADGTTEVLSQEWSAVVAARPLVDLSLGLDLGFSQESNGYSLPDPDAWYGASWAAALPLVVPWDDSMPVERAEELSADIAARFRSLDAALSIDASATGTDYTSSSRTQEDTIDISWSVSWPAGRGGDDGLAVTLRYARSLELAGVRPAGDPFTDETAGFFKLLADQRYFLLGLPLLEILLDDTAKVLDAWDGVDKAAWKPSLSVSVERRSGSRLADLFLPSTAELSVARVLEKRSDLSENAILIKPRVGTRALNLFGRLGSHPVMPFYRTDEFNISLSSAFSGSGVADLSLSELTLELYADILGFKEQSLTLVNVFTLGSEAASATDNLQATFDWATRPAGGVRLPYVPEPIAFTGYFEHRESLDFDLRFGSSSSHPLTLLLGHATSLVYPDRGSIKGGLKAGFDVESLSGTFAYRFAIEASLEAKLSF